MFELGCHVIDLLVSLMGKPRRITPSGNIRRVDDRLMDNTLAVFEYPHALATVKSSAMEVEGFDAGTWWYAAPKGRSISSRLTIHPYGCLHCRRRASQYRKGYQDVTLPKYTRYVDDAADMARIIRGEKADGFPV